jgi:hypothetical protein
MRSLKLRAYEKIDTNEHNYTVIIILISVGINFTY